MFDQVCKVAGWIGPTDAENEGVGEYISQISALDPDSERFRSIEERTAVVAGAFTDDQLAAFCRNDGAAHRLYREY